MLHAAAVRQVRMCRSHASGDPLPVACCMPHTTTTTMTMPFTRCHILQPCTTFTRSPPQMDAMTQEFEDFFSECRKRGFSAAELRNICRPLCGSSNNNNKLCKICVTIGGVLALLFVLCNWCDGVAWFMSAIGRLLLLQVLPFWDWTPLYNSRCLITRAPTATKDAQQLVAAPVARDETDGSNCALCATLERVPTAANVSYSFLEYYYLERGLPVIVSDSHAPKTLEQFMDALRAAPNKLLQADACDVATNLLLKKLFNLELALEKVRNATPMDKWFLQWRNCQTRAVKASRSFVTRPYYYPLHLEPFYSSWVLMSQRYEDSAEQLRELYLQGLVFVQQLHGSYELRLRPKRPCERVCPVVNIRLSAGECLVFSSELWTFSYGSASTGEAKPAAVATVLEIDWQL